MDASTPPIAEPQPAAKPKLDDQYWFDFSQTLVGKALDARDQAAAKLQTLVLWLWGIYTSLAAIGFTLASKNLSTSDTTAIMLASGALIAVYWLTVWVQMPKLVQFEPRSPDDIRVKAYAANLKGKQFRLTLSLLASVVAAALVAYALTVASTAKPVTVQAPRLTATLDKQGTQRIVAVTAYVGKTDSAMIVLGDGHQSEKHTYLPADGGLVQASIPTQLKAPSIKVAVEWSEAGGTSFEISRVVK